MKTYSLDDLVFMVDTMTEVIIKNEVAFCELDSVAGDGDFGMSVAKGFKELRKAKDTLAMEDIGAYLKSCGLIIVEHCGGASGPIWGSGFRAAGLRAAGKTELTVAELGGILQAAVEGIQKRGGAKLGDKTLLDALIPCAEGVLASAAEDLTLTEALARGARAAVDGAEKTKLMVASKGRASYVGERSLEAPDAGAAALGIIFTEVARAYQERQARLSSS